MKDGPVPSLAYNVLKGERAAFQEAEIESPLWVTEPFKENKNHFSKAARDASEDLLSDSDFEELDAAIQRVLELGVTQTWIWVHKDAAYQAAWNSRENDDVKRVDMDYALMFEEPNKQLAEELKFISEHM